MVKTIPVKAIKIAELYEFGGGDFRKATIRMKITDKGREYEKVDYDVENKKAYNYLDIVFLHQLFEEIIFLNTGVRPHEIMRGPIFFPYKAGKKNKGKK